MSYKETENFENDGEQTSDQDEGDDADDLPAFIEPPPPPDPISSGEKIGGEGLLDLYVNLVSSKNANDNLNVIQSFSSSIAPIFDQVNDPLAAPNNIMQSNIMQYEQDNVYDRSLQSRENLAEACQVLLGEKRALKPSDPRIKVLRRKSEEKLKKKQEEKINFLDKLIDKTVKRTGNLEASPAISNKQQLIDKELREKERSMRIEKHLKEMKLARIKRIRELKGKPLNQFLNQKAKAQISRPRKLNNDPLKFLQKKTRSSNFAQVISKAKRISAIKNKNTQMGNKVATKNSVLQTFLPMKRNIHSKSHPRKPETFVAQWDKNKLKKTALRKKLGLRENSNKNFKFYPDIHEKPVLKMKNKVKDPVRNNEEIQCRKIIESINKERNPPIFSNSKKLQMKPKAPVVLSQKRVLELKEKEDKLIRELEMNENPKRKKQKKI